MLLSGGEAVRHVFRGMRSDKFFVYGQIKELDVDHLSLSNTQTLRAVNIITGDCTLRQSYPSDQHTLTKSQFNRRY